MSDSELGPESAAAVAEAGAAATAPEGDLASALAAFAAEHVDGGEPATADTSTPDAPAEADAEGDYNEEDHREEPPSEDPPAAAAPDGNAWPEDVKKTWDQYRTEEERAKALAENKRYGIEQAAEAKRLKAELEALKAGKAPAAETAPAPTTAATPAVATPQAPAPVSLNETPTKEDIKASIERLKQEDPAVAEAVESLGQHKATLSEQAQTIQTLRTSIAADQATLDKLANTIEYLTERSKGRPDDFELKEELEGKEREFLRLETKLNGQAIKEQRLVGDWQGSHAAYQQNLGVLRDIGIGAHQQARAQAESDRTFEARRATEEQTWKDSFSTIATELKIPEKLRPSASRILLALAVAHPGDIGDVLTWQRANAGVLTEMLEGHRETVLAKYGDDKRADASQPAPRGPAAVATAKDERPYSSADADREARKQLGSLLGAR